MPGTLQQDIPADYSALFTGHFPHMLRVVKELGIDAQDAEDVAMTILAKFVERDALHAFDPEHESGSTFSNFIGGFVSAYIKQYQHKQWARRRRNSKIPVTDPEIANTMVHEDVYEDLEYQDLVDTIRKHLVDVPPRVRATLTLSEVFEKVLVQFDEHGEIRVGELSARLGFVRAASSRPYLKDLRDETKVATAAWSR